jgi:anti-anti-sigma regulatory factor
MDITTERPRPDVAVVTLTGELDASNFEELIDTARALHGQGCHHFVIDLSGLSYMGSSGLVAIHSAAMLARGQEPPSPEDGWDAFHQLGHEVDSGAADGSLRLVAPTPSVDRVLERTGMKRLFEVHPDRDSALGAIHAA